jgi:hypothetical protein
LSSDILRGDETIKLELPAGAQILSADLGDWHDTPLSLWCLVNRKTEETKTVEIMVLGTGFGSVWKDIAERLRFINTVINNQSEEVYHVFQLQPKFNIPFLVAQEQPA